MAHSHRKAWQISNWQLSVVTILFVPLMAILALSLLDPGGPPDRHPTPTVTTTVTVVPPCKTASVTQVVDPIDRAKLLKPLADLAPGDRVLYRGRVAFFQVWNGSIDQAGISRTIASRTFFVKTGFLTPVEMR